MLEYILSKNTQLNQEDGVDRINLIDYQEIQ